MHLTLSRSAPVLFPSRWDVRAFRVFAQLVLVELTFLMLWVLYRRLDLLARRPI